jgi:hypothetical protein
VAFLDEANDGIAPSPQALQRAELFEVGLLSLHHTCGLHLDHRDDQSILVVEVVIEL